METLEFWRPVTGYEGVYEVSNLGNVKSLNRTVESRKGVFYEVKSATIKPFRVKGGYYRVNLCKGHHRRPYNVHFLVAREFVEGYKEGLFINHKDENKANNNAANLEWCTAKYNCNYGTRNKRISESKMGKAPKWSCNGKKRMIESKYKPVIKRDVKTGEEFRYDSICFVKNDGFQESCVWKCANGKQKTHLGCTWRYA